MLKKTIGSIAAAGMLYLPWPMYLLASVLLLWAFWEELTELTLAVYDDHQLRKTAKAMGEGHHSNVRAFYAHLHTMRKKEDRERKARFRAARKRAFSEVRSFIGKKFKGEKPISLHLDGDE